MGLGDVVRDLFIVLVGFSIAMFFIWRPPVGFGKRPPSHDSQVKLSWFAVVGLLAVLVLLLITDYRVSKISWR